MNNNQGSLSCAITCAAVAFAGGVVATALLILMADWLPIQAIFIGLIVFAVAAVLLNVLLCRPLPALGEIQGDAAEKPAPPAAKSAPAPDAAPAEPPAAEIKPSTPLAGEAELAERKGDWKYEGDAAPASAEPEPVVAGGTPAKPETLSAAREGGPDNLKEIKGVGPKLEALLHSMGFYHFDQVASWGPGEVAWVDENLEGFKGRVTRDNWVAQAKILAAGGETEFSKKVDKGGVY